MMSEPKGQKETGNSAGGRPEKVYPTRDELLDFLRNPSRDPEVLSDLTRRAKSDEFARAARLADRLDELNRKCTESVQRVMDNYPKSPETDAIYIQYLEREIANVERSISKLADSSMKETGITLSFEWYKHLATLSSGALILVGGFLGATFDDAIGAWLAIASILLLVAAMWGAFSVMGSISNQYLIEGQSGDEIAMNRAKADHAASSQNVSEEFKAAVDIIFIVLGRVDGNLRSLSPLLFIVGVLFFVVFGIVNAF